MNDFTPGLSSATDFIEQGVILKRRWLRRKCPYSELFWSAFSRIRILRISPHSVQMRKNADQNNSEYGHFSRSGWHMMTRNTRDCQRFMKSKLTEKYDKPLLFATVEQNRPIIIIISIASLECQPVLEFLEKTVALKQVAAILKEDRSKFVKRHQSVSWPQTINKLGKDSRRPPEIIQDFYWYVISTENSYHSGASDSINLLLMSFNGIFNGKLLWL